MRLLAQSQVIGCHPVSLTIRGVWYYMTNRLIHGDCLNTPLPSNYFDTIITDPPYGLGFMGKDWDAGVPGKIFWKKFLDACKPGAFAFVFGGTRTYHRLACAIEDAGWEIRDCMMWLYGSGFPKSLDISKAIDKIKGAKRKRVEGGIGKKSGETYSKNGGYVAGEAISNEPISNLTKLWDGWGTTLKPAWEPIIVAMKPLDGTFAHNAEKWGVGGLWVDGGRIGDNPGYKYNADKNGTTFHGQQGERIAQTAEKKGQQFIKSTKGRWPANVVLDEEAGAILDEQTNRASRFFYCAKASRKEREMGLENLSEKLYARSGGAQGQVAHGEDEYLEESIGLNRISKIKNDHPTVKPLALMEYLCKLNRPPQGGIVLDPFAGSGTTALACMNTDRQYVVIEKEREYCDIIAARLNNIPIETIIPQRPRPRLS